MFEISKLRFEISKFMFAKFSNNQVEGKSNPILKLYDFTVCVKSRPNLPYEGQENISTKRQLPNVQFGYF